MIQLEKSITASLKRRIIQKIMSQKNRMSNLTETHRAKIQAHLNNLKKNHGINSQYLNDNHRKSEQAKGEYLNSLNPSEIDWEKEKERQIINARND